MDEVSNLPPVSDLPGFGFSGLLPNIGVFLFIAIPLFIFLTRKLKLKVISALAMLSLLLLLPLFGCLLLQECGGALGWIMIALGPIVLPIIAILIAIVLLAIIR